MARAARGKSEKEQAGSSIAARVVELCGGAEAAAEICGCDITWVRKWTYPRARGGRDGHVPHKAQIAILRASREGRTAKKVTTRDFYEPELVAAE